MKRALTGFFLLPRPVNCLIMALSVYVGSFTAGIRWPTSETVLAMLSAALILGAGNAFNDIVDLNIDRINRPDRPLPAGLISRHIAILETLGLTAGGLILAWWLGPTNGLIASSAALLLLLYSLYLKMTPLWGNLVVSLLAAAAFPYGALISGSWGRSWIPAGFALLFHLGREIIKDIEDVKGDATANGRTLPLRWGIPKAVLFSSFIFHILIGFTFLPWIAGLYGKSYLALVALVDLALLYALFKLRQAPVNGGSHLNLLLKTGMFLGLLAIVSGEVF